MSITIYNEEEIEKIRKAGLIIRDIHEKLPSILKPGISTEEIDLYVDAEVTKAGGSSPVKGYNGFPGYNCVSINDCVVHGIPDDYKLRDGDLVTVDIVVDYKGYKADRGWTYVIGKPTNKVNNLLKETERALYEGLNQIKPGEHLSNVSNAIQKVANQNHFGIVEELAGHGVGKTIHEDPLIVNYGPKGQGPILEEGMVLAIEPMFNLGKKDIYIDDDDWAVRTLDGKKSAHFEHTIVVTKDGYEIVT